MALKKKQTSLQKWKKAALQKPMGMLHLACHIHLLPSFKRPVNAQDTHIRLLLHSLFIGTTGSGFYIIFFPVIKLFVIFLIDQMIAELIGTYFIIFAGCGAVAVDKIYGKVTFPGVCVTWGLIVMVMIYSLAHISGAHFNPAVTIALAIFRQFKWRQVSAVLINSFKENVVVKQLTCD